MAVPVVNIVIEKNSDFQTVYKLRKDGALIDLTGYTFSSKMKKSYSSNTSYQFSIEAQSPLTSGIIKIGMASSITSTIPEGRYFYDILITSAGKTTKVIEGNALVKGTAS